MKKLILIFVLSVSSVSCSLKSKKDSDIKDQDIKTTLDKSVSVSNSVSIGVNEDKDVLVQEKVELNEYLRQLASSVRQKQDELYGSQRFSTRGLYGKLERCLKDVSQKTGSSTKPLVARSLVIPDRELGSIEAGKFGFDEGGKMVALDSSKLRDKIRELEEQRKKLNEKEEELIAEINRCESLK